MHLTLIVDAGARAWTGPLAPGEGRIGRMAAGPEGVLSVLEAGLGLTRPWQGSAVRAAGLVPALGKTAGFWSASLSVDPLGVAQDLLRLRDRLAMAGWRGQAVGVPRMDQLAAVTGQVAPGIADRLFRVAQALAHRGLDLQRLDLVEDPAALPLAWRQVLDALSARGVEVAQRAVADAAASGDLAGARQAGFTPRGDLGLQLVRPPGPLQAADDVAAWLAAQDDWQGSLIVGADAVLDAALERHGLPTVGGQGGGDHALLQLLPLVVELGWEPPDPHRVLELLTLPVSPISRTLSRRLVGALQENPAVNSPGWQQALTQGLAAVPDERRPAQAHRAQVLLRPSVPVPRDGAAGGAFPVEELLRRVALLADWGRARRARASETDDPAWAALDRQLRTVRELATATGLPTLTRAWLRRLLRDATQSAAASSPAPLPARVGLHGVGGPAEVVGPAHRIIWWSFHRGAVSTPRPLPLSQAERAALADAGVHPRSAADRAVDAARRWDRPLLQASQQLLLLCASRGVDGESLHPHPLWDRITGRIATQGNEHLLQSQGPRPAAPTDPLALRALPRPRRRFALSAGTLPRRQVESPSSAERMVRCDLSWVLNYIAKARAGSSAGLPGGNRLKGTLAHALLAQVLEGRSTPEQLAPDALRTAVLQAFDEQGPHLAAPLFQPGMETERARTRAIVGDAARALGSQLQAAGVGIGATEEQRRSKALGGELAGTPDLLTSTGAVIDLKWSGAKYRTASLAEGSAVQLAAYSRASRADASSALPAVAYFILAEQRLLTTDAAAFPAGEHIDGPGPGETWLAFERTWKAVRERLDEGVVLATELPVDEAPDDTAQDDEPWLPPADGLALSPPCRFCDYSGLCGLRMVEPVRTTEAS